MSVEIERKFLLTHMPAVAEPVRGVEIEQGYIFADDTELRLRRFGKRYFITIKSSGSGSRNECENEIEEWAFRALWPKAENRTILKERYAVSLGEQEYEIDVYFGRLAGLITVECEFMSDEDAAGFVLPTAFGKATEVTSDPRFKNKNLAKSGLPPGF